MMAGARPFGSSAKKGLKEAFAEQESHRGYPPPRRAPARVGDFGGYDTPQGGYDQGDSDAAREQPSSRGVRMAEAGQSSPCTFDLKAQLLEFGCEGVALIALDLDHPVPIRTSDPWEDASNFAHEMAMVRNRI